MAPLVELDDPRAIERVLRRDPELHVYELGDLDPSFWPRTRWFADAELRAIALLYAGGDVPTLVAFGGEATGALLDLLVDRLPPRVHAHLSLGLAARLEARFTIERIARVKMALRDPARLDGIDTSGIDVMTARDVPALLDLYARAYPGNWFDPRMIETGCYFGVRDGARVIAVAGVHVHAPAQRVAAIGNVATDPAHRGARLATRTVAALCRHLRASVDVIGLNVAPGNAAALACYRQLGFVDVAAFEEVEASARTA